ncbi:MAG: hypothetical protein K0Q55_122 [Verrucomicrobia bacterium]|jgi:putative membrane protein|nr:hypothetical protein [Verrucomicrobiota bacterium]
MKKNITIQTSLLVLCASLCVPAVYADDQRKPAEAQMQSQTPQQFVRQTLRAGQKEVILGELALKKTEDPQIRILAQDMVQDHSKLNTELKEIAQRKGFDVPPVDNYDTAKVTPRPVSPESIPDSPALGTDDRPQDTSKRIKNVDAADADMDADKARRRLSELSGVEFDRAYVKEMVSDHKQAVSKFETASKYLADSELKAFASKSLPTLRTHLEHAQRLDRQYSRGADEVSLVK